MTLTSSKYQWTSGVNGDWATAGDWSLPGYPDSTANAVVAAPGNYTVTITSAVFAASLTVDAAGAVVSDSGTLTLGADLILQTEPLGWPPVACSHLLPGRRL